MTMNMLSALPRLRDRRAGRVSSWDHDGGNYDRWIIAPGETAVLADIRGPAQITHIWMTQDRHYRECLLRITYDNAAYPSVVVPLGDFFGLGHSLVNSYQSLLFSASTEYPYQFEKPVSLNGYVPMPFAERAVVELVNESDEPHRQYFYIDYETLDPFPEDMGYFHAEFRRTNPFGGWAHEIPVNSPETFVANTERLAWDSNYVILETRGRGHYIGCNLSITNFTDIWWGEGDDMIWVDGYKWPPDLHGTGTEDYFGQAWGMQEVAFLRQGSSIFEGGTLGAARTDLWRGIGGYHTSYVFHVENPVYFAEEIKVTIEHGHANHQANEMSSVAYWYAEKPTPVVAVPPTQQRLPVLRDQQGHWIHDPARACPGQPVRLSDEMRVMKARWAERHR